MRTVSSINTDWVLSLRGTESVVTLPHTWNAEDGQTDRDYYRGEGVYTRVLPRYEENVFLEVNAANTRASVYVNDHFVGEHSNGYGMFRFDITEFLYRDNNILQITVDNSADPLLYPAVADFTYYGGIYREVNIISGVSDCRFALLDKSRSGVYITPKTNGRVYVKSVTEGETEGLMKRFTVFDAEGKECASVVTTAACGATYLTVPSPRLWQGREDPSLYTLKAEILRFGEPIDEVTERFGFRRFGFDNDKGFYLNGKPMKLKGVSRHQDREGKGNALTLAEHAEDIELICEVGANSVRLAHYQQSHDFYSLCDEKGLLVWAEIPVISKFSAKKQAQAKEMLEELIKQNYNHPSIFCWGIENEISMTGTAPGLRAGLEELNNIAHLLDPNRPTTCAQISFCPPESRLNRITDIMGYNHYFGWYMQTADRIGEWLDDFHEKCPDINLCLSEYGAEGITTLHSENPVQGDYSEDYQARFHEKYLEEINRRDWLWGSYVWNMFDFGSASRNEGGVTGRNNKGLVTIDRKIKKDAFWLYKAWWSEEKFVRITGERFVNRLAGETEIRVYSNASRVTLRVNGEEQTAEGEHVFRFGAVLKEGENLLEAEAEGTSHAITVCGVKEEDPAYKLGEGQHSFVRNWFEYDGEIDPDKLSLNDPLGEIVGNSEVIGLMETHLGRSIRLPKPVGKLPLKPAAALLAKTKKGKELTDFANQYLQTIKKDGWI